MLLIAGLFLLALVPAAGLVLGAAGISSHRRDAAA